MLVELKSHNGYTCWINPRWVSVVREARTAGKDDPFCYVDTGVDKVGTFKIVGTAAEVAAKLNAAEEKNNA